MLLLFWRAAKDIDYRVSKENNVLLKQSGQQGQAEP